MYIISKLFTYLVLPPGIFIILFFLASIYAKKFKAFFLLVSVIFYALSNSYVSDFLLAPLEKPYNHTISFKQKTDGVVVLGGGSIAGSSNLPLANEAYKRAIWGTMVAKKLNIPLIFSGAGFYKKYTEAQAFLDSMQEISNNFKVPMDVSNIFDTHKFSLHVEDKSLDTYQNAKFSKKRFQLVGIQKPTIYLVTSAYHMKRAKILYEYFGFTVIPSATDFKISNKPKDIWDYLPNINALKKSYIAFHEFSGLFSLYLRGVI